MSPDVNETKSSGVVNINLVIFVRYVLYNNDTKLSHFCEICLFVIYFFVHFLKSIKTKDCKLLCSFYPIDADVCIVTRLKVYK